MRIDWEILDLKQLREVAFILEESVGYEVRGRKTDDLRALVISAFESLPDNEKAVVLELAGDAVSPAMKHKELPVSPASSEIPHGHEFAIVLSPNLMPDVRPYTIIVNPTDQVRRTTSLGYISLQVFRQRYRTGSHVIFADARFVRTPDVLHDAEFTQLISA